MKAIIYFTAVFLFLTHVSCDKKRDRFFDVNPTERLSTSVNNAYQTLQANKNGWIIKYFPNSTVEFGGYTLFANFTSNVNVELKGDYNPIYLPSSRVSTDPNSSYLIYPGAGPILTFDTYNSVIHYFSLPAQQFVVPSGQIPIGAVDQGYKGDFEFLVIKATADSVILEGRKTLNRIVMIPISSGDAGSVLQSYKDAVEKFHPLGGYSFEVGDKKISASFLNTVTKRALRPLGTIVNLGYRYVPGGLEFYKEYEIEGVKFKELKYVEPTGTYTKGYFTNDAGTIKLVPTT